MEKIDKIEDFKSKLMKRIMYREERPEEIIKIIEKEFQGLQVRYEELCGKDSRLSEYIQGKAKELEAYTIKQNDKKIKLQVADMDYVVKMMGKSIEEKEEEQLAKRKDEQNKKAIENLTRNNRAVSRDFLQVFDDSLRNIRVMANRNLVARQFDTRRIDQINEQITYYMRNVKSRNEVKIYEEFQNLDKELIKDLLTIYDEYIYYKEDNKKTGREEFVDSLDAKIPLEQQRENTDKILEKIEKENQDVKENGRPQGLPRDIII